MAVVEVRDLRTYFDGGRVRAIDGVDLATGEGEYLVLLGPSGCGKTTLLSPVGNGSGWPWPGRWSASRRCSCWTSRCPTSTPSCAPPPATS
ncbi:ATP-binding cassette domain-containing protein [Pseudonocardia sp. H11422]|uniref:ATP-binding cassette domain-containing protein n=1 Tax=Pseudonocardia sp. H11422 TaxID=2835866 RepID=UPI003977CFE3